jgi:hypothetical protein
VVARRQSVEECVAAPSVGHFGTVFLQQFFKLTRLR